MSRPSASASGSDAYGLGIAIGYGGFAVGSTSQGVPLTQQIRVQGAASRLAQSSQQGYTGQLTAEQMRAMRQRAQNDVIQYLNANRSQSLTISQLIAAARLADFSPSEKTKFESELQRNAKIHFDSQRLTYAYAPVHPGLSNAADVLALLQRDPYCFGVSRSDLSDAYAGVDADLDRLQAERQIYILDPNEKPRPGVSAICFPVLHDCRLDMDTDIKRLWSNVKRPHTQTDMDDELYKAGHLTQRQMRYAQLSDAKQYASRSKRKAAEQKARQEQARKPRKRYGNRQQRITNVHLEKQLPWLNEATK